jgi:acylphosphatase
LIGWGAGLRIERLAQGWSDGGCRSERMAVRYTAFFSGQVQGVGFRYMSCRIARRYKVTGFVRNLSDGRVELVAEGASDQAEAFIEAVRSEMSGYIERTELRRSEASQEFGDFGVAYA